MKDKNKNENLNPLVSIITVNYNGKAYLNGLFKSLSLLSYAPVELILVDNASTDGSVEFVRDNYPEVTVIKNPTNFMYAKGNNIGINTSKGDFICLINNDVVVDPNFLEPLIHAFQADEKLGACQPKILRLDHPDQFEYSGAAGGFLDRYGYPFLRGRIFYTIEKDSGQYDQNIEIFWASGACLMLYRKIFDDVDLLDEDFILHMEEIDLCWRLHLKNWKIKCITESVVFHKGGGTLDASNPQKFYWNFRNNIFLLLKNYSAINLIRYFLIRIILDKMAFIYEIFKGNVQGAFAIIRAYWWILNHLSLVMEKRRVVQKGRIILDRQLFDLIYPGSIVWEYFIGNRKTIMDLKKIIVMSNISRTNPK